MEKEVKITPQVVQTIESVLEERKSGGDRRRKESEATYDGEERRSGDDRRNPDD